MEQLKNEIMALKSQLIKNQAIDATGLNKKLLLARAEVLDTQIAYNFSSDRQKAKSSISIALT